MKVGLIDVDSHNYPNLPLMKLSAWHKEQGDQVEWYEPLIGGRYDLVYMSKVFSFSPDYLYEINADEVIKGGSGYCIDLDSGREIYRQNLDHALAPEVEHCFPDYSLYGVKDTAYGFLTRGCPRGCLFCHVSVKEGKRSKKVADLGEFWNGQKYIELLDPNILACPDWENLLDQLARSKAKVNFNQGLDVRLMTEEKAEALRDINIRTVHFAWDRYEDKDFIIPKLELYAKYSQLRDRERIVYILCNFNTTVEQDLERVYTVRELGYSPYIMLYDKEGLPKRSRYKKLQRWVNNRFVFWKVPTFEEYEKGV